MLFTEVVVPQVVQATTIRSYVEEDGNVVPCCLLCACAMVIKLEGELNTVVHGTVLLNISEWEGKTDITVDGI